VRYDRPRPVRPDGERAGQLAAGADAGGTLYPVSAFPMSKGEWRDHFGSAFGQLDAAKQQYDPDEILTPGYEIF
jgi:FAD/FMN-containing dehydrogenase